MSDGKENIEDSANKLRNSDKPTDDPIINIKEDNINNESDKIKKKNTEIELVNTKVPISNINIHNQEPVIYENSGRRLINENYKRIKTTADKSKEKIVTLTKGSTINYILIPLLFVCVILIIILGIYGETVGRILIIIPCAGIIVIIILLCNHVTIPPNTALVLSYYGRYIGTVKEPGYYWIVPCTDVHTVSLKSKFYNGNKLKVNERDGNPVLLGVIIVWKVRDTAKVIFDVNDYQGFIGTQSESAIRFIGCKYPYEPTREGEISLRGGQEVINEELREELERRVWQAGIEIEDARITEIEYAPEVATMMLKKHAAQGVVTAKEKLVYGALDLVDHSIQEIKKRGMADFNKQEQNKFVTNMMTLLCMESNTKPIINFGN